ncbi:serine protease [Mycolicibacter arupensis]|uniref:serine protease n=1 Tax=Mycolicibacter arupensis TaxID=342002 RepID=UPI003B3B1291
MHQHLARRACAISAVTVIGAAGLPTAAAAESKVLLGGGAAIVLHDDALCTLTTIGRDGSGSLVGFTAAHCGGPGSTVLVEGAEDQGIVGTVVAADEGLDYAVIEFDPGKVASIADYEGFGIYGIGSAEPPEPLAAGSEAPEQPVDVEPEHGAVRHACKLGRGTGLMCFDIGPTGVDPAGEPWWEPGDDGSPVTVDDLLVGMIHDGTVPNGPLTQPGPGIVLFQAVLDDVDAKGGPGAGFGRRS